MWRKKLNLLTTLGGINLQFIGNFTIVFNTSGFTQGFSRLFCIFIDKIKSSLPLLGLGVGAPGAPGGREDQEAGGEEDQGRGVPVAILFRGEGVNRTRGAAFL